MPKNREAVETLGDTRRRLDVEEDSHKIDALARRLKDWFVTLNDSFPASLKQHTNEDRLYDLILKLVFEESSVSFCPTGRRQPRADQETWQSEIRLKWQPLVEAWQKFGVQVTLEFKKTTYKVVASIQDYAAEQ